MLDIDKALPKDPDELRQFTALLLAEVKSQAFLIEKLRLPDEEPKDKPKRRPIPDHIPRMEVELTTGDDDCAGVWQEQAGSRRMIRFGYHSRFDVWADAQSDPADFTMQIGPASQNITLQIDGRHNVRNAMAAAATAYAAGFDAAVIARGLSQFTPAAGRMRRVEAGAGIVLIDDTYNANPDSVRAAIDVLAGRPENIDG